ncbi:MAG TPA: ATP-dependent zinc metalloprotease FtsH [Coxiellaceae bacterium]|nr:ATP-dependent zinc metalloprotease FtsH [Coxiellaceae bacterium]
MSSMFKNFFLWLLIAVILITVFNNFGPHRPGANQYSYSQFVKQLDAGNVKDVTVQNQVIEGVTQDNQRFITYMPMEDQNVLGEMVRKGVNVMGRPPEQQSVLMHILISWFPMLLLIGVWIFFMRQMQGGGGKGGPMAFGRSRARMLSQDQVKITFKDVAGVEEAKNEVRELVEFLKDPGKFQRLGGKIPRGVLLMGAPGTGKTLLAKAVAGEAKVPFFTISGSDFVEMFVGVGASRVRDMFEQAKKQAPCIIFIDEIDAVGRHRGAGLGGGHDEREQTLNQLLVEMDGFSGNEGVIVMAATNRPDVLDPALLRPGRFDRQVVVPLPDIKGREQILKVHMSKLPLNADAQPNVIARGTPGFSGADLASLVNEAALFAAKADKNKVGMVEFEKAKDKILMGAERRSMVMSEAEKKLTAYHEAGHAIVGLHVPSHDPVYKVSIIPRGRALGVTMFLPEMDRYSHSRELLEGQLCSLFGGRLAEEIFFGEARITTGASNDIEKATGLARSMVTKWGFSQKLGPITYGEEEDEVFLGRSVSRRKEVSEATAQTIDSEVHIIINAAYARARKIIEAHKDKLEIMAQALIKYETIDEKQIKEVMAGHVPSEPEGWAEEQEARALAREEEKEDEVKTKEKLKNSIDKVIGDETEQEKAREKETKHHKPKKSEKKE